MAMGKHMRILVLLLAVTVACAGCSQPSAVVYLYSSDRHVGSTSSPQIYLSQVTVISEQLPEVSGEISDFIDQKLSAWLTKPSVPPASTFVDLSLECHFEASQSVAFTEPLPEGVLATVRFDLTELASHQITRSLRFEACDSSEQPMTLQTCFDQWLDELSETLHPSTVSRPYTLARGISKHDRQGRKLVEQGDHQAALRLFQKAIDAHPNDHAALYNAGLVCEVLVKKQRALSFYQRAYRISPKQDYQTAIARIENALP